MLAIRQFLCAISSLKQRLAVDSTTHFKCIVGMVQLPSSVPLQQPLRLSHDKSADKPVCSVQCAVKENAPPKGVALVGGVALLEWVWPCWRKCATVG